MNVEKGCHNCLMRCSQQLKTCASGEFAMWRPRFIEREEEQTAESNEDKEQAQLLAQYIASQPKEIKRKADRLRWQATRKDKMHNDEDYAEHSREMARARYWKDPDKSRADRLAGYRRKASTDEGREQINASHRKYMKYLRENEPERYAKIQAQKSESFKRYYANRTDEQRAANNARHLRNYHRMVLTESPEEKAERNARNYAKRMERWNAMTPEEQQAWRDKKNARRRELRAQKREAKARREELIKNLSNEEGNN